MLFTSSCAKMSYSSLLFVVGCTLLLSLCVSRSQGDENSVPMKKYKVDLDQPPDKRWLPLLSDYNSSVPLIIKYFEQQGTKIQQDALKELMSGVEGYFGELGLEMKAIAEYFNINLGVIVTLNLAYELRRLNGNQHPNITGNVTVAPPSNLGGRHHSGEYDGGMACTSIVAQNVNGEVYHGRNLDWNLPNELRNLTVQAEFWKGGKVIFSGDVTVGMVGVFTGLSKQGGFSISINERGLGGAPMDDAVNAILKHSLCPSHLTRQVLTTSMSYVDAMESLKLTPLMAPVYYITAGSGLNEGAVITRDKTKYIDLWLLSAGSHHNSSQKSDWYLLETNYDHWKAPVPHDNRRAFGIKYMEDMGQIDASSVHGLLSVLSKWPVRNNLTAYTTLMSPRDFYIESYNIYN